MPKEVLARWTQIEEGPLKGRYLFFDPQASPGGLDMLRGTFEPFIYEAINACGNLNSMTVWDVGAHVGYHALAFASMIGPLGQVVAFEPNPYNAERLQMNLENNRDLAERVICANYALSNADGEAPFILCEEVDNGRSSGSHLAGAIVPADQTVYESFRHTIALTARGDTLVQAGRVPAPSIIKIDVEGAEVQVLEGIVGILCTLKPTLLIEVHSVTSMFYAHKLLSQSGYELRLLNEQDSTHSRCFVSAKADRPFPMTEGGSVEDRA
jgi:FkbM family methyltransferase